MPRKPAKRGPGRPSLGADARSVVWTIKVTPAIAREVDQLAESTNTTRAAVLLDAIDLALARGSTR